MKMRIVLLFKMIIILTVNLLTIQPIKAQERIKIAILDLKAQRIDKELVNILNDIMVVEVQSIKQISIISKKEIETMLGFEAQKQMIGCEDDISCIAEIVGAYGVDMLVSGSIGKIGAVYIINLQLINIKTATVENRISEQVKDDEEELIKSIKISARKLMSVIGFKIEMPKAEIEPIKPEYKAHDNIFKRYFTYAINRADEVSQMDLYGVTTTQLPKRILGIKYKWNTRRADTRYDKDGNEVPLADVISLEVGEGDMLTYNINPSGHGHGHTFQISYGITDPMDFYIELPFQTMEVKFEPEYTPPDNDLIQMLVGSDLNEFHEFLESMGRPEPGIYYKSDGWEWGDIHAGVSWNYYRDNYLSLALTGRVFFPTGEVADPDNALNFALGPELDRGMGGYGPGATHGVDFRLPPPFKWLTLSQEISWQYILKHKRKSPTFLEPDPTIYEPISTIEPEVAGYFPDLTNLDDEYDYTPGHAVDGMVSASVDLIYFSITTAYAMAWTQKPELKSNLPEFEQLLDELETFESGIARTLGISIVPDLFRFSIPAILELSVELAAGGKDTIVFKDNYSITTQVFIPF